MIGLFPSGVAPPPATPPREAGEGEAELSPQLLDPEEGNWLSLPS